MAVKLNMETNNIGRIAVIIFFIAVHYFYSQVIGGSQDAQIARLNLSSTDAGTFAQCHEWNISIQTPVIMVALGHVNALSRRIEEGVSCLQRALTAYERAGIGVNHSLSVEQLGETYLLADRIEDVHACADRALMLARGRGERGFEA
jgi:hypothetical protein